MLVIVECLVVILCGIFGHYFGVPCWILYFTFFIAGFGIAINIDRYVVNKLYIRIRQGG
jgi:uncharacterized membrane protein AbrB (regulator of aidB expression)